MTAPSSIRIVPELRAVHVERHRLGIPAELLYLDTNYDLVGTPLADGIYRASMSGALRRFASTTATILEVPEPLWMRFWPKHVLLATGFRIAGFLRRRPHRVVTYAMENNDFATLVGGVRPFPSWVVAVAAAVVGATARCVLDRICFASDASRATYERLPFVGGIERTTIVELPRAVDVHRPASSSSCVFVGAMEDRKGIPALLAAWPWVEAAVPGACLVLVGPGPLLAEAALWAEASPSTRHVVGRLSHAEAEVALQAASVLVAPSVPDGRWREQIGLPIKEALSAGLTVVTTEQTGLAPWLHANGHEVVDQRRPGFPERLACALVRALRAPLDRAAVRRTLPDRDGRLSADSWLHGQEARIAPAGSAHRIEVAA